MFQIADLEDLMKFQRLFIERELFAPAPSENKA